MFRIINSFFSLILILVALKMLLPNEAEIIANDILMIVLNIIHNALTNLSLPQ